MASSVFWQVGVRRTNIEAIQPAGPRCDQQDRGVCSGTEGWPAGPRGSKWNRGAASGMKGSSSSMKLQRGILEHREPAHQNLEHHKLRQNQNPEHHKLRQNQNPEHHKLRQNQNPEHHSPEHHGSEHHSPEQRKFIAPKSRISNTNSLYRTNCHYPRL